MVRWYDARLQKPGQYRITINKSADNESSDQTGACLVTENASDSFQASSVKLSRTSNLAYVIHSSIDSPPSNMSEVANIGSGTDDVITESSVRSLFPTFFRPVLENICLAAGIVWLVCLYTLIDVYFRFGGLNRGLSTSAYRVRDLYQPHWASRCRNHMPIATGIVWLSWMQADMHYSIST